MFEGKAAPLTLHGINMARSRLGVDAPALWAVLTVETSGCGFLPDRRPKILFERHWFSRLTGHRFDALAPDISHRRAGAYGSTGAFQYERLAKAMTLDRQAALESTSWGLGQVMAFNAAKVGYAGVEALVIAAQSSEDDQLDAMVGFVLQADIARYLRRLDWAKFAFHYNGPDFQKNQYDEKLDMCHKRYVQGPLPDLSVRALQSGLMMLGYGGSDFVDGWFGKNTQKAVLKYQQQSGLPATGAADAATMAQMRTALGW
ncbi:MAG: DUF3380 domain-containing protein [Gammaproteobacteria bacterium]|nr:DUF3380 domain-containing protein [Gammaproteobacteria bacterium]MBU0787218.1 DUF3380 domain-containing protein [Gammaproteobacteria bacterium]MBU0814225.1 DUF3380 domain-containing protein [Gammaproteobacteria bacterium]MBU1786255.1 DUF3380 domain-containing protein [Gammaproteobacteria bacterium]